VIERDGLTYCNDGDWVESCSAIVERHDGSLELIAWRPAVTVAAMPLPVQEAA
jgi:UDP-2,3-diacylglucosamine pyrophosphatase LpxH